MNNIQTGRVTCHKEEIQLLARHNTPSTYGKLNWHAPFLRGKKMRIRRVVICLLFLLAPTILSESRQLRAADGEKHLVYVAVPGIRNYVEYGGVGILVYDIGAGHKFVKRIPTWDVPPGQAPENVKGIAASARTGRLYVSTTKRLACFDVVTEKKVWEKMYEGGSDRMAISPDGKTLYVPSLEGPNWHIVDASTGDVEAKIELRSGAHNTIYGPDGSRAYLAGLHSPVLSVAGAQTPTVGYKIRPFTRSVRPVHINRRSALFFVDPRELLAPHTF